ncbi:MAG TPA: M13 family metallopeptidase N-terminal domain-containing protein, partial [Terriglobales bacterium]|nr:M13 family metallopeptidase N-terminal domain-containing protein [Terriglobales bacterium]
MKRLLPLICLGLATAVAQSNLSAPAPSAAGTGSGPGAASAAPAAETTIARPKSFDVGAMDKTANPCEDFYQYSCGNWRKNNPIPGDQSRWGRFGELAEYNRQALHQILEKASANDPKRDPITQKVGDMYASCMDEAAVNQKGSAPLKPILDRIDSIKNKEQMMDTIAWLHSSGIGALFGFGSQPDLHNASLIIANIGQGGIGLPDRDYYLAKDPKSVETREKYQAHVANMLVLLGEKPEAAQKHAQAVMDIETKLAEAAMERVKMRDPKNRDHKMKVSELATLAPNFQFVKFFGAAGAPAFTEVNVVPPDFF